MEQLLNDQDVNRFLSTVAGETSVVVEFGFPVEALPLVLHVLRAGLNCWWFDGDRAAAFESWKTAHPHLDDALFRRQVAAISGRWPAIAAGYAQERIVRTIGPGPFYLPSEEIHQLLGLTQ